MEETAIESTESGISISVTAEQVNAAHSRVVDAARGMVGAGNAFVLAAAECGRLLRSKKREVGHGNFLPWLSENCPLISDRTARDYMRLSNWQHAADLQGATSIREALRLLDEKENQDETPREKPAFVVRCTFNKKPEEYTETERKNIFDQSRSYLQVLEHWGLIRIEA